ncbi:MAG TPA: Amuc_1100 family pilus-like protein [Verrucomicrobiota bacterium]|nr:Amuc_1100 family pilus-like protein [Verrucomicrobiota bacterium]HNU50644.1 Amuc_1100 family pilus-like protein [Verrucomicrobiota bacterium]
MAWLKKNLLLVLSGVVALVLLGVAGYFLWSRYTLESQVTQELTDQTTALNDLMNKEPHPGNEKVDNIKAAQQQDTKLQEFAAQARKTFVPLEYPTNLDSGELKLLLDTTIDELQRSAGRAGVKLQPQYAFTFQGQKSQMQFEQATLLPLARMLTDIRSIAQVIIGAKVLALDGIRRCPVSTQDTPGATGTSEFWNKKPLTNEWAIVTPYEFTFHSFTAELGAVLEGLYRSSNGFLVKNIVVDPSPSQLLEKPAEEDMTAMPAAAPGMSMMQMQMMMRYGLRGRYAMPAPQPQETPSATSRGGLSPMLDEKPFRVVLQVEVLRLLSPEEAKAAKTAARSRPVRPAVEPGADGTTPADGSAPADPADPAATPAP